MGFWACASLRANRIKLALNFLDIAGFSTYAPLVREEGRSAPNLLFPGYCFVRIEAQWRAAARSPGVVRIVMNGDGPGHVGDAIIASLRAREGSDGLIVLPKPPGLTRGERIRVTGGIFRGQLGVYAGMSGPERCEVLLTCLGAARVQLDRRHVLRA